MKLLIIVGGNTGKAEASQTTRGRIFHAQQARMIRMRKHVITIILLILMAGCVNNSLRENCSHVLGMMEGTYHGEIKTLGILKIWLPSDSVLMESNGIDSEYWLWQSRYGKVSITWIGEIARESFFQHSPKEYCRIQGVNHEFYIWHEFKEWDMIAVSEPLLKGGGRVFL